jgi:hypothetical protein
MRANSLRTRKGDGAGFRGARGFFLSIDSFISITMMLMLILLAFFYMSKVDVSSWNSVDLKTMASDQLSVLEKSLALENSVKQYSAEPILAQIDSSPNAYCFETSIFGAGNLSVPVIHTIKTGCIKKFDESSVAERALVVNADGNISFYVAREEAWVKQG